ncbi:CPBP family intramembrane glutamic endopeptidase [Owenweeksia hongkongensis]|uniref:CPBP family intramembrane glutamic endopeptidase n=1 Tax=Owenweeksia hongkongensis TaxID=253245 RepID=UPI003A920702
MKSLTLNPQKVGLLPIIVIGLTVLLPVLNHTLDSFEVWTVFPTEVVKLITYQVTTLALAIGLILLLCKTQPLVFTTYFKKGKINAEVTPVPALGIKPKNGQNWKHIGWNFTIVISLVTAAVIFFSTPEIDFDKLIRFLPITLALALINSFVEETVTRLGIIVSLKDKISDKYIAIISGSLFGIVHYWGTPGGFGGVLLAGFLGWLLAKSILETKGIFWAWLIHFCQDIIIISALLSST